MMMLRQKQSTVVLGLRYEDDVVHKYFEVVHRRRALLTTHDTNELQERQTDGRFRFRRYMDAVFHRSLAWTLITIVSVMLNTYRE
jgi:hypothetical protein